MVRSLPLQAEPGHALVMFVGGRFDAKTNEPYELGYDEIMVDPRDGTIQGRRQHNEVSLQRAHLLPFLYRLHYSLHLGDVGGFDTGRWLMGVVAMVWFLDGFIALWISFPSWKVWRKSFAYRFRQGPHKLTFDLHRSSGVWTWLLLTVIAFTAISMNLSRDVVRPAVAAISPLTPSPFEGPRSKSREAPALKLDAVIALARAEAARRGFRDPLGSLFYFAPKRIYGVSFHQPGAAHGDWGLGNPRLYYDADSGALVRAHLPGQGSAGDVFMQAQFPLHSGRILGLTGRVLITLLGLLIAMLSATGVILWARKKKARARQTARLGAALAAR
jgi:uncharacterized iron-regulated membrane protein